MTPAVVATAAPVPVKHRPDYHPRSIRNLADYQAVRIARFVARHPEYERLPADVLLQYADTYRDDEAHTLEQEFRDNGILTGCRADYARPQARDRGWEPPLDSDALGGSYGLA